LHKKNAHRHRQALSAYPHIKPIGQALAPCLMAGCCAVNELVSRALFIGDPIITYLNPQQQAKNDMGWHF